MPFCTNCGTKVDVKAAFCQHCGSPQRSSRHEASDFLDGLSDRSACILCYIPVFGVIPAIIFLASERFRTNYRVRFNAFQGLYLFVAWLIISSAAPTLLFSGFSNDIAGHLVLGLIKAGLLLSWIFLLVKSALEQQVRLPILGDLAARSTSEQL